VDIVVNISVPDDLAAALWSPTPLGPSGRRPRDRGVAGTGSRRSATRSSSGSGRPGTGRTSTGPSARSLDGLSPAARCSARFYLLGGVRDIGAMTPEQRVKAEQGLRAKAHVRSAAQTIPAHVPGPAAPPAPEAVTEAATVERGILPDAPAPVPGQTAWDPPEWLLKQSTPSPPKLTRAEVMARLSQNYRVTNAPT
jgi:hypothetical protein